MGGASETTLLCRGVCERIQNAVGLQSDGTEGLRYPKPLKRRRVVVQQRLWHSDCAMWR
jgi:hypothetical protein